MHKSFNCIHQLAPMCKPCGSLGECASALTPNGISISLAAFTEFIRVPNIEINIHTDLRTLHISKHQDCQTFLFVRPYRQFLERSWARLATSQLMKHGLKFKKKTTFITVSLDQVVSQAHAQYYVQCCWHMPYQHWMSKTHWQIFNFKHWTHTVVVQE